MRVALLAALTAVLAVPTTQAQAAYQAALRGGNEVPPVETAATGGAKVFIDGTTVFVQGAFRGLSSAYQASHIHRGAPGENGPVALSLTAGVSADGTEGSWDAAANTFTVSQALADSIANGLAYVNVHTADFPAGEIRGPIVTSARTADLVITGVFDGPLTGGSPKVVELYAVGDIPDLSRFALGSANNGGGSDGAELVFDAVAVTLGTYITITDDADAFQTYFGQAADAVSDVVLINGDDAIELFYDADDDDDYAPAEIVDTFGEPTVDGTGTDWEYLDGWAYRKNGTRVDGDIFRLDNWTFSGVDANDGQTTNATAPTPFPLGTFSPVPDPVARLQIIHNSPDPAADTVDVYVDDVLFLDDLAFREATAFVDVPFGTPIKVDIVDNNAADNAAPVFTESYTLDEGAVVQLIATGVVGTGFSANPDGVDTAFTLLVAADAQEEAADFTKVDVRVVHGAPDAPTVDVASGGSVLVDDAAFQDVTAYLPLDPGTYVLDVTTADGATTVASYTADLSGTAGAAATVLASGFLTPADDNDGPAFGLLLVNTDGTTALLEVATANEPEAVAAGMALRVQNPVRDRAAIVYDAGVTGRTTVAVFDALGRQVVTLVDEAVVPGEQTAALDASALAPGVYVVRLSGEAGALTRTITVVR